MTLSLVLLAGWLALSITSQTRVVHWLPRGTYLTQSALVSFGSLAGPMGDVSVDSKANQATHTQVRKSRQVCVFPAGEGGKVLCSSSTSCYEARERVPLTLPMARHHHQTLTVNRQRTQVPKRLHTPPLWWWCAHPTSQPPLLSVNQTTS